MKFDVTIIGSGPGGYVAAIRCAQLGLKTAIVERYPTLGGTCLNVGCIPSKALLDSSGISTGKLKVDFGQMISRKQEVVDANTKGIEFLMKKNKIEVFHGHGSFKDKNTIIVKADKGVGKSTEISTDKVIIATGSKPTTPASFNYDKNRIITSTEALSLTEIPKRMLVIGAGVIGMELGSVYARLGTEVEVIEFANSVVGGMDKDLGRELKKVLTKLGMKFHLNHKVTSVQSKGKTVTLKAESNKDGKSLELKADYCLIAIGRSAYTDNLGLDKIGVTTTDRGKIPVDAHLQTSVPGIYAIGDVIDGAMLAHKAEEEGVFVAEQLVGQKPHIDYNLIPGVVYTWPEVAAVGKTEQELKEAGIAYKVGKFPFRALGRARASDDLDGFIKIIADEITDEILGVHIIGARAADLIAEGVALMEYRATAEDASRMSHAHPTYAEAFKEAALGATASRPLHM